MDNTDYNRLDGITKRYVDYRISGLTFSGGGTGSGTSGSSGTSGISGSSGTSGISGTSGTSPAGSTASGVDGASTFRFRLSSISSGLIPGAGNFTIDAPTTATASIMYISRFDNSGNDVQSWITTLLSNYSTQTTYVQLHQPGTTNEAVYQITGYGAYSGGDWFSFDLSLLGGGGTYSVNSVFSVGLIRDGAVGANGTSGISPSQNLSQTLSLGNSTGTYSIQFSSGSAATPSVTFLSDTDTGFYRAGANNFRAVANGLASMAFTNVGATAVAASLDKFWIQDGIVGNPGLSFENDTDTGLYRPGTNSLGIAVGGAGNLIVDSLRVTVPTGSVPTPSLVFSGENTTGISRPGPAQIGISITGATAAIFNSSGMRIPSITNSFLATNSTGQIIATASPSGGGGLGSVGITIDGGGSPLDVGLAGFVSVPYSGTITGWELLSSATGSVIIDVWKDTFATFPPTVADSIAGTEKPTLTSQIKNNDNTLTTWNTSITAGDIIAFNVDDVSVVTRVTLTLKITKS